MPKKMHILYVFYVYICTIKTNTMKAKTKTNETVIKTANSRITINETTNNINRVEYFDNDDDTNEPPLWFIVWVAICITVPVLVFILN